MRDNSATGCLFASETSLGVVTDLSGGTVVDVLSAFVDVDAVDEEIPETWGQFHQHSTSSFYARRSQKHKKAA